MHIAILGRQSDLSIAELEAVFGSDHVDWFSSDTATVQCKSIDVNRLGGSPKAGVVTAELPGRSLGEVGPKIAKLYAEKWAGTDHKITLGISAYGADGINPRDVQKIGITIKQLLKKSGVSVRLVPNSEASLNTATSHHNKLGLSPNKVELLVVKGRNSYIVAESTGAQNITALARRDQGRPKRDAFVGMLPPKLAMIMINLAAQQSSGSLRILDPFCGTGVILQEAALLGHTVYGTDLSEKMIDYTRENLNWLQGTSRLRFEWYVHEGNAMDARWRPPIDAVVSETYLGQPFSAPPSPSKLQEVRGNVNHITTEFLKNIHGQLLPGTPLCLAVPAWRDTKGNFTHLPLISSLENLGYTPKTFTRTNERSLLYYRENQVVARELLVLTRY